MSHKNRKGGYIKGSRSNYSSLRMPRISSNRSHHSSNISGNSGGGGGGGLCFCFGSGLSYMVEVPKNDSWNFFFIKLGKFKYVTNDYIS